MELIDKKMVDSHKFLAQLYEYRSRERPTNYLSLEIMKLFIPAPGQYLWFVLNSLYVYSLSVCLF